MNHSKEQNEGVEGSQESYKRSASGFVHCCSALVQQLGTGRCNGSEWRLWDLNRAYLSGFPAPPGECAEVVKNVLNRYYTTPYS